MKIKHLFIFASAILLMAQCKKDKTSAPDTPAPTGNNGTTANNLTDMFSQNGVQAQTSTAVMTSAQTITVGTVKVSVPASAFVTQSGTAVTGSVDVVLKNISTKKDIILSGAPGNANGKLIATKGCVKINATQNGQVLRMASGNPVHVSLLAGSTYPTVQMKKYYAASMSTTDSTKCWNAAADTSNVPITLDSLTGNYYYDVSLDSLSWLNCGYVWDTVATKTNVTINVDTTFTKVNCAVYISLNNANAVGALYEMNPHSYRITNIPVGKAVNIVAIAVISGQYYSSILPVTITSGYTHTLTLQATTLSQIQTQLSQLP